MTHHKEPKDLYIIFGPPGSGKTIQANFLSKHLNLDHISWGFIFRDGEYQKKYSEIFNKMNKSNISTIEHSKYIGDIIDSEFDTLIKKGSNRSLIIDGYPRRLEEAEALWKICRKHNLKIKSLININPSFEAAYKRLSARLFCSICKKYYDETDISKQNGVCDIDGGKLSNVIFDKNKVKDEFIEYFSEAHEAIESLKKHSKNFFDVSGDDSELIIFSNILLKLNNLESFGNFHIFERKAEADLETEFGVFKMISYQSKIDFSHHFVLVKGNVKNKKSVLIRVHSSCITGDIFSSKRCDCGEQLERALKRINAIGSGVLIYLFQEGRGINIINKIKAYNLQKKGHDTVEANILLGLPPELRTYSVVKDIIDDLKIQSVVVMTNNPDKIKKLTDIGIVVEGIDSLEVKANQHNEKYLKTKKDRMGHILK